jgi:CubicO group peptidase (beta-lactamase class C family)
MRQLSRAALVPGSLVLLAVACGAPAPARSPEPSVTTATPAAVPAGTEIPNLAERLARLAQRLEHEREALHVPGMAFALVRGDEVLLARGFGVADLATDRPVDEQTLFAIGSSTKAFTATLIGTLVDEGKLAWDDPLARWLSDFHPVVESDDPAAEVTLRDALSHRSGLSRNDVLWISGRAPRAAILAAAGQAQPMAPFRKEFHYNNVMYVAAGEAAARAGEASWEELVRARFLEPLGMRGSTPSSRAAAADPRLALGYDWNPALQAFERRPMRDTDTVAPAGSICSTARDMSQWLRLLASRGVFAGKRLVSEAALEETWKPAIEVGGGASYGMGWFLHDWRGQRLVEHGGNIDGFAAEVALLPDAGLGCVLLANVSSTPLQGTLPGLVWSALLDPLPEPAAAPGVAAPATEDLTPYLGIYRANFAQFQDARFEVKLIGERLAVDVPGQMAFELLPPDASGKRAFALVPDQIQVTFERDASGAVVRMHMYQGGLDFEVPREGAVLPIEVPLETLAPYLGAYRETDGKTLHVLVQNEHLSLDYPGQMVYELRPPDASGVWRFRVTDELGIEFHLDEDGQAAALTFHERGTQRVCPRIEVPGQEAPPSLDEILALRQASAVEARIAALGACRMRGKVRFVHAGAEGSGTTLFQAPDRLRDEVDLGLFGSQTNVVDGEHGALRSSFEPSRELAGPDLDQARLAHPSVLFGDWRAHFDSVQVIRTAIELGRRQYVVQLGKAGLPPLFAHVDFETGDLVKLTGRTFARGTPGPERTTRFEDWRVVEGLRIPFRIVTEDEGTGRVEFQMESFETGLALPEDAFVLGPE